MKIRFSLLPTGSFLGECIKKQASATPLPFTLEDTTPTLPGVPQNQIENCIRALDEFRITDPKHRNVILASADHIRAVNRCRNDLQTNKRPGIKNPGGLLLVACYS